MQVASVAAGFLFFTGWWFALDASISHHKAGPISCLLLLCTLVHQCFALNICSKI